LAKARGGIGTGAARIDKDTMKTRRHHDHRPGRM